jgi:hypothetical protein
MADPCAWNPTCSVGTNTRPAAERQTTQIDLSGWRGRSPSAVSYADRPADMLGPPLNERQSGRDFLTDCNLDQVPTLTEGPSDSNSSAHCSRQSGDTPDTIPLTDRCGRKTIRWPIPATLRQRPSIFSVQRSALPTGPNRLQGSRRTSNHPTTERTRGQASLVH